MAETPKTITVKVKPELIWGTVKGAWFIPALTLMFVAGKIWGGLDWSWWLVFLPIWGPAAVIAGIGIIILAVAFIAVLTEPARNRRKHKKVMARRKQILDERAARIRGKSD